MESSTAEEALQELLEEHLSDTRLRQLLGEEDLNKVINVNLHVNCKKTSLNNLGASLPKLARLKLSGYIPTIRGIGTHLDRLVSLKIEGSKLADLEGIGSIPSLTACFLAFNVITEISSLALLENLNTLDLRANLIDDLEQIEYLTLCPELKSLQLQENPIFKDNNDETICGTINKMLTKLVCLNKPQPEAELEILTLKPAAYSSGFRRQRFKTTSSASRKDELDVFSNIIIESNSLPPMQINKPTIRAAYRLNRLKLSS